MNHPELSHTTYGLIGNPLGHSRSKAFFTELFAKEGSSDSYDNFELKALTPEALYGVVILNPRLVGFNVTAPYKEEIMQYLDSISEEARAVGAVNTVRLIRSADGAVRRLKGFNTDVEGFRESVREMVERLTNKGALILGTGGASKAVAEALRQLGVRTLKVSRSKVGDGIINYGNITAELIEQYPLIVNATPLGTHPNVESYPPFPYELLSSTNACHDLVYNPDVTEFMRRSAIQGATVKNGLEMLHRQALASLHIWRSEE